ncbi:UNVERIFIED_CONTAM: hypothetical protein Sradi_2040000 [Sesamum radiatum]|uniref:Uncharacterized protein n=1 Tax=Sesamum radiatum TaxID=300843 RepID=A0AAW2THF0_SESRA
MASSLSSPERRDIAKILVGRRRQAGKATSPAARRRSRSGRAMSSRSDDDAGAAKGREVRAEDGGEG